MWFAKALTMASTLGLTGCLITTPTEFDDTALPAHLSGASPFSFSRVPPGIDPACGDDNSGWMEFRVDVSDANLNEPLVARLIVNGVRADGTNIRVTGALAREPVSLCATLRELNRPCNRVEMVVTAAFDEQGDSPYTTRDPNDFSKVEWWVLGPASDLPNASSQDCAELADAGAP
jgi:hypothetical protein